MEPIVQRAVSTGRGGVPKVVSIGSGLANIVSWSAIAFGFRGVGFDVLPCCTKGAEVLHNTAVEVITRKQAILEKYKESKLLAGQDMLTGAGAGADGGAVSTGEPVFVILMRLGIYYP